MERRTKIGSCSSFIVENLETVDGETYLFLSSFADELSGKQSCVFVFTSMNCEALHDEIVSRK